MAEGAQSGEGKPEASTTDAEEPKAGAAAPLRADEQDNEEEGHGRRRGYGHGQEEKGPDQTFLVVMAMVFAVAGMGMLGKIAGIGAPGQEGPGGTSFGDAMASIRPDVTAPGMGGLDMSTPGVKAPTVAAAAPAIKAPGGGMG